MRLLLDSQALLWWMEDSPRLGRHARDSIADPASIVWVSAAVAWEIVVKTALGRLVIKEPPQICIPREMEHQAFQPLPVSNTHAFAVAALPNHHRDPFDRMLIAQAKTEGLTVVTADAMFARYGVMVLDAAA